VRPDCPTAVNGIQVSKALLSATSIKNLVDSLFKVEVADVPS
jgi:hypothetical protein